MFRLSARHPAVRVLALLPGFLLASCGSDTGAIITVPNSVVVSDLKANGVLDVVIASAQIDETGLTQKPGLLGIMMNSTSSPGTFGGIINYDSSSAQPSGLAVGDLTGTGSHDIVVANFNAGTLSVFMETSATSGSYGAPTTITVGGHPNDVQMADLNNDGLPDLIVADDTGKVEYLLQNHASPGTFAAAVSLPFSNPAIVAEGPGWFTRGISVAVGDLDGDGLPDIAVTSFDGFENNPGYGGDYGMVYVFFQDPSGSGTFNPTPMAIPAPGEPSQIRIADVNKDGSNDIVIALQGLGGNSTVTEAEASQGAMVILNSGTAGTFAFAAPVVYPAVYAGSISLAIGDLNADGWPDIALCGLYPQGSGSIATLMQDPTAPGTFLAAAAYTGQGQTASIVIGDLDNDGLPDLVTADATSAVWYKNQSATPGTFATVGTQIGY
jgi:hypothetical protein